MLDNSDVGLGVFLVLLVPSVTLFNSFGFFLFKDLVLLYPGILV